MRISNIVGDPETTTALRSVLRGASNTLNELNELLIDAEESGNLGEFKTTLTSINRAANEISSLLVEVRQKDSVNNLNATLASVGGASEEIRVFLVNNETNLAKTLDSITRTSDQLRLTTKSITPIIKRVEQGELLDNLEALSANTVKLTANLADFSSNLDDPQNILLLEQTLNSARASFENIQKITSDVDELTGNPQFRQDLQNLIQGLSNLTSSTQLLEQQIGYDRDLKRIASEIAKIKSGVNFTPTLQPDINQPNPQP